MANDKEPDPFKPYPFASRGVLGMLRNSQWKHLFILLIPGLVFIPVIFTDLCLGTLVLPVVTVILIWLFKVDKFMRQLIIGVFALLVATLLISAIFPTTFSESANDINSSDGTLVHGKVTPFKGGKGTSYNFTISVVNTTPVTNIVPHVVIYEDVFGASPAPRNQTMLPVNSSWTYVDPITHNNRTYHDYYYETTLGGSVNGFGFTVLIDGKWTYGAGINGPISSDPIAVFGSMVSFWVVWIFGYGFMQYIVLLLFLRFSSRSREAREKMLQEYKKKKEAQEAPQQGSKRGSPKVSVGTEDMFVCSECGADVQASAKYCPNCGEPFDDDEDDKEKPKKE
jgi:hypothetical protein